MNFIIGSFNEGVFVYPTYTRDWIFAWAISKNYSFISTQETDFACLNIVTPDRDSAYYKMTLGTKETKFKLLFTLDSFEELLESVDSMNLDDQPKIGPTEYQLIFLPMEDYTFVCCEDMYKRILATLRNYETEMKKDRTHLMVSGIEELLKQDEDE